LSATLYIIFKIVNNLRLFFFPPLQPVHDLHIIFFHKKRQAIFVWKERCSYIDPGFAHRMHISIVIDKFPGYTIRFSLLEMKCVTENRLGNGSYGTVFDEKATYVFKKFQLAGGGLISENTLFRTNSMRLLSNCGYFLPVI